MKDDVWYLPWELNSTPACIIVFNWCWANCFNKTVHSVHRFIFRVPGDTEVCFFPEVLSTRSWSQWVPCKYCITLGALKHQVQGFSTSELWISFSILISPGLDTVCLQNRDNTAPSPPMRNIHGSHSSSLGQTDHHTWDWEGILPHRHIGIGRGQRKVCSSSIAVAVAPFLGSLHCILTGCFLFLKQQIIDCALTPCFTCGR